ncbi:MAG: response regulator [Bacteroidia bacterium]|nr:response regulator [Bacteroidia bacterium]
MKALILDQEEDIRDLLAYILEQEGFEALAIESEADVCVVAAVYRPHVILLGTCTDEIARAAVCRSLRKIPGITYALIIFLTTDDDCTHRIWNQDAGMDACVSMPVTPRALLEIIRAQLATRAA